MASLIARLRGAVAPALVLGVLSGASTASAAFDCNSSDPSQWPPSSRPYFMLAIDTSGSMTNCTNPSTDADNTSCPTGATPNSCGLEPTRINDAKCAIRKTVEAFAGEVNFGLMTYAHILSGCSAGVAPDSCPGSTCSGESYASAGCTVSNFTNNIGNSGCGNEPNCNGTNAAIYDASTINTAATPPIIGGGTITLPGDNWRNGGNVVVDMLQDPTWAPASAPATNVAALLEWVDNRTDNSHEIFADGFTPLEGILRTAHQYYVAGWSSSWTGTPPRTTGLTGNYCLTGGPAIDHASPLSPTQDRPCRSLNVILVTDGAETCGGTPANAAQALYKVGTVIQGFREPIRTFVIGFTGAAAGDVDPIADMGDDGQANNSTTALVASNELTLSQALSRIISGSVSPESCNNVDDNCNGCVDEGFKKYCDRNKTGRSLAYLNNAANNPGADDCCNDVRANCLAAFAASISPTVPKGNQYFLPCWDPATDNVNPQTKWLCADPGESCDNVDNNCDTSIVPAQLSSNAIDEGFNKCPNCPVAETCNGVDDNCDGIIDNASGSTIPYSVSNTCVKCTPTAEVCDGCDNNCDGNIDEGAPSRPCGFPTPPQCAGTEQCQSFTAAGTGGYCAAHGLPVGCCLQPAKATYSACSATGTTETCNGVDDNCDGIIDNNPTGSGAACTPNPGDPTIGTCKAGQKVCENGAFVCVGYVGPTTEICDGLDNDCDGLIDAADPDLVGMGGVCGSTVGACSKGTYQCIGGVPTCVGGKQPTPEICNGIDDDCNGITDDGPLADAPTDPGCWTSQSSSCSLTCGFAGKSWCPPPGATCTGLGTLKGACAAGKLICQGTNGWVCQGDVGPTPEQCNGLDDDCNGTVDDGTLAKPIGDVCGKTVANSPCTAGVWQCVNGNRVCSGTFGSPEVCNGIDDDCDGVIDNGLNVGGSCTPTYDTNAYPGARNRLPCKPGVLQCDPTTGGQKCVGGVGPQPEVCDGVDNDCDGQIDESGPAPDGLDGTADPGDPTKKIGAACGADAGVCEPGTYACLQTRVVCQGGKVASTAETCNCADDNCNGQIDEDTPGKPVCSPGKTCVALGNGTCQCAPPCNGGEFKCPGGQTCDYTLVKSGTTDVQSAGVCVQGNSCGDCSTKTVTRPDGTIACAPAGSHSGSSRPIPVCVCKGLAGCREPCYNPPQCPAGQACAPLDATCRDSTNCNFFGCPDGQTCSASGTCGKNPCDPNPCSGSTPVCRPSADLSTHTCVGSCAGVTCNPGEVCADGACKPNGCGKDCTDGLVCIPGAGDSGTGTCGPSQCPKPTCDDGTYCEPTTGRCGPNPCTGVACPAGQVCENGQCVNPPAQTDGGNANAGGSGNADSGSTSGGGGGGNTGPTTIKPKSAFGLATGGGGCACSVPERHSDHAGLLAGLGIAISLGLRRRRRSQGTRVRGGSR